jgi:hypothetical protein
VGDAIARYVDRDPQGEFTLIVAGFQREESPLSESVLKAELQIEDTV